MDGLGSHMTYEFVSFAHKYKIELFRLPPCTTHHTQSLNVGCFQPYKHYHTEAVNESI